MKYLVHTAVSALAIGTLATAPTNAQSTSAYMGDVLLMANTYCPEGWASAEGQSLSISSMPALYAVIGTTYGGDGVSTFALPDLQGRVPIHRGQGPGLSTFTQGMITGRESVALTEANLPSHTHDLYANSQGTNVVSPAEATLTNFTTPGAVAYQTPPNTLMDDDTIGTTGQSQPVSLYSPSVGMRYCINTDGQFPPRN